MVSARFLLPSLRKRQLLIPLTLAASMALTACGGSSDKTTATSVSQSQSTTAASAATAMPAAPTTGAATTAVSSASTAVAAAATSASSGGSTTDDAVLKKVADAWSKQTSYKITLNAYNGDEATPSFVNVVETEPDKEHTVTTAVGQTIETITIGSDTYALVSGSWQKSPGLTLGNSAPVNGVDVVTDFTNPETDPIFKTKITKKDDEKLDGVATNVYELTDITGTVTTIWFGKDDHLPRKSEIKTDNGHMELLYSDYGKDFGIKAPI
jgi:hypothetical protein